MAPPHKESEYYWTVDALTVGGYTSDYFYNPGRAEFTTGEFEGETKWSINMAAEEEWITFQQTAQLFVTAFAGSLTDQERLHGIVTHGGCDFDGVGGTAHVERAALAPAVAVRRDEVDAVDVDRHEPGPPASCDGRAHVGGGESEARRDIITNVLNGGRKLMATLKVEFGARPMAGARM